MSARRRAARRRSTWVVVIAFALVGGLLAFLFAPARVTNETEVVVPPPFDRSGSRPPPERGVPIAADEPGSPEMKPTWPGARPPRPEFDPASEHPVTLGPFHPRPAMALYVVLDRPHARARVQAHGSKDDFVMVRSFDAGEGLVHWQYVEPGLDAPIENPRDTYVDGLPPLAIAAWKRPGKVFLDGSFALVGEGVHQVRLQGGRGIETLGTREIDGGVHQIRIQAGLGRTAVRVALSEDLPYGVSFQNGDFTPWGGCPRRVYAYVPPRARWLHLAVRKGKVRVLDEAGRELWRSDNGKDPKVPVTRHETVWTFELPPGQFSFRAWGFPLILCTSREAARAIHASVEVLDDGAVVCHRFQRRIAELMPKLLAPENVGLADDLIVPLSSRREGWLADPLRNVKLCGYSPFIRGIAHALRRQNVDPASRWSGAFEGYDPAEGVVLEDHRWDTFLRVHALGGSQGKSGAAAAGLAKAALLDNRLNPYFGRRELLYRTAAACLRDLMVLNEAEVWPSAAADPYPSSMSFPMGQKNLPPFALSAPHMPDDVRDLWTEGVRRMVDRAFTNQLVTCRNQSSHCLVVNEEFARGSGDRVYTRLSRLYAKRFARGAHPAGWHMEACGPCGSYIGMTHWHMAVYYRLSGDDAFLQAIRRSYRYFNHTVAPEPDGRTMLGGFNFNHRVGMGFFLEQWSGAKGILDDVLPEVGLWAGPAPTEEGEAKAVEKAKEKIARELAKAKDVFPGSLTDPRFFYYAEPDRSGVWPAKEKRGFIRNIANDLIAVKRPAYYLAVYVGKPAGEFYIRGREKLRPPYAGDGESRGVKAKQKPVTPYLGGGMTLFWTPEYGTALMATNWSPLCHHGLVATRADGKRYWEDYHKTDFDLDEAQAELTVTGRVEGHPLAYTRRYRFADDELSVEVELRAEEAVRLARLIENVPLAVGKRKKRGAEIVLPDDAARTAQFHVEDETGAGVEFVLDRPRPLRVCPDGLVSHYRSYQIGRVEIGLPAELAKGERVKLAYRIRPSRRQGME